MKAGLAAVLFAAVALCCVHADDSCNNMNSFRSQGVQDGFDPKLAEGQWFEHAYIDMSQDFSRCNTMNITVDSAGVMDAEEHLIYTWMPWTIHQTLSPEGSDRGVYTKTFHRAGFTLSVPTVVVDATTNSTNGGQYETLVIFSCDGIDGISFRQLQFWTRSRDFNQATLDAMTAAAQATGLAWDPSDVHRAWQVECAIPLKTLKYDFLRRQNYTKPAVRLPTD